MGDVLPLCNSPQMDFNQNGRQSLMTVLSFFMKFRWAWPSKLGGPPDGGRKLIVGIDGLWWCFASFPLFFMIIAFMDFISVDVVSLFISVIAIMVGLIFHVLVLYSIVYWHESMRYRLMGAKAKFMIEIIPVITAATLRHLLGFNHMHI